MSLKILTVVAAIAGIASAAPAVSCRDAPYTKNALAWTPSALRMNQLQVVGSHNSYHVEPAGSEIDLISSFVSAVNDLRYSEPHLATQLESLHVRSFELDLLADKREGGNYAEPIIRRLAGEPFPSDPAFKTNATKVMHIPDLDVRSVCNTLVQCLGDIKGWLDGHPDSAPVPILLEFKTADNLGDLLGGADVVGWDDAERLAFVDAEIRSVFGDEQLVVPDDLRREGLTLEESILQHGWPDLDSARGRVFFLMDNGPVDDIRTAYVKNRPNLEGRAIFTNSAPGNADCVFQKRNDPVSDDEVAYIQRQVKAGYFVRTRSDIPLETVVDENCSTSRRDDALRSGAHVVSTDFPAYGMSARWGCDYAVRLPGGKGARCNPINGGSNCDGNELEPPEYTQN